MPLKTYPWDGSESLDSPEAIAAYVEALLEDGDPRVIALGLGDIARAKGMAQIAKETGISRAGLYKALREEGDPKLSTLTSVMKSLGMQLSVKVMKKESGDSSNVAAE